MRASPTHPSRPGGFTIFELLTVIAIVGLAAAMVTSMGALDRWGLSRAARLAESHLVRARLLALSTRDHTLTRAQGTHLVMTDRAGSVLTRVDLAGAGLGRLDSVRVRPTTLRFNARGHGSAGSIYLYRGRRGVRVVSNFVGRARVVPFRV